MIHSLEWDMILLKIRISLEVREDLDYLIISILGKEQDKAEIHLICSVAYFKVECLHNLSDKHFNNSSNSHKCIMITISLNSAFLSVGLIKMCLTTTLGKILDLITSTVVISSIRFPNSSLRCLNRNNKMQVNQLMQK